MWVLVFDNGKGVVVMKEVVLRVTLPDGSMGSRRTARGYTHVVVCSRRDGGWRVLCWCGRLGLAEKAAQARRRLGLSEEVRVVYVDRKEVI